VASRFARGALLAALPDIGGSIVKRTVKEQISEKLISHILTGSLQVGDLLPGERELAAAFSVSRESVRSAIQDLASRGLLEVSQGARTRVVSADVVGRNSDLANPFAINRYDLPSVHGARLLAERAVVADAAQHIESAALARLETSLAAQKHCLDDPVRFLICDREFHSAIYRSSSNPLLADFVVGLYTYLMENRRTAMSQPGAMLLSFKDHCEILAGLRARDAEAVVAAFERHLERIYNTTRAILDAAAPDGSASAAFKSERR
jgi:DNA-binding FadR family transcriptional regulator